MNSGLRTQRSVLNLKPKKVEAKNIKLLKKKPEYLGFLSFMYSISFSFLPKR